MPTQPKPDPTTTLSPTFPAGGGGGPGRHRAASAGRDLVRLPVPSWPRRPAARTAAAFAAFITLAALANLAVLIHPLVPVGFGLHATPIAFLVAVIDAPTGRLYRRGGRRLVWAAVLAATIVATALTGPFGLCWGVAYLVGDLLGECTWRRLQRRGAHPLIVHSGALVEVLAGTGVYVWLLSGLTPVTVAGQLLGTGWGLLAIVAPTVVRDSVYDIRDRLPSRAHPAPRPAPRRAVPSRQPRPAGPPGARRPVLAAATIAVFAAAVAAANALTARYGFIPVGLGLTATAGTYAAGFCLLARDWVHDSAGRVAVLAAIGAAGAASAVMAGPRLAAASAAAFVLSELADLVVYQPLRRRGWLRAVIASNAVGAPVDTVLFLALAGFPIWAAVPGQLLAKATATAIPVAVVLAVRALLRHRVRAPGT